MTPFTYVLTHISGKRYYGARWAKGCHPNDMWTTYFTSSRVIKRLIEHDGKDSFKVEIRKTFDDPDKCRDWEQRVLVRLKVSSNDKWLNMGYGAPPSGNRPYKKRGPLSEATKAKIAAKHLGRKASPELRKKLSEAHIGIKCPWNAGENSPTKRPEVREKMALAHKLRPRKPNLGNKHSEESKALMRAKKLGKKQTPEHAQNAAMARKRNKDLRFLEMEVL